MYWCILPSTQRKRIIFRRIIDVQHVFHLKLVVNTIDEHGKKNNRSTLRVLHGFCYQVLLLHANKNARTDHHKKVISGTVPSRSNQIIKNDQWNYFLHHQTQMNNLSHHLQIVKQAAEHKSSLQMPKHDQLYQHQSVELLT